MSRKTWFTITASASNTVEIDLLDEIGAFGISTQSFLDALRPHKGKNVTFNVDCPGGSCEDGLSIYDAISEFTGKVTMNIVGTAASMASVIILAADERIIAANGRVMIHRVTAGIRGNPDQLQAGADLARQFEERIIGIYRAKLAMPEEEIRDKMKTEIGTWFFGEEAVKAGFATRSNGSTKARAFKAEWSPLFTMLPAALFDTSAPPPAHADPHPQLTPSEMKALLALAKKIGIAFADNATEDQIVTAIDAWQPPSKNVVIDFEDADVKAAFGKRITDATAADKAKITALETELANIKALLTNGPASAAGGNPAVTAPPPKKEDKVMARSAFNKLPHSERNAFMAAGGKLTDD
ncbi:MAG: ATP-dependent Clp protease proteolytic subunit [Elusimicrobia bacterium]|nr:ATP-dependent Clp protease proteolytic subunit [Elusimicrobiota bacterium]